MAQKVAGASSDRQNEQILESEGRIFESKFFVQSNA
jgi:hypothetical protein